MRLSLETASTLITFVMAKYGHNAEEAAEIARHLMDCEVRGLSYGGLARVLSIVDRFNKIGAKREPIRLVKQSPVSAVLDGGDQIGYLVADKATKLAIEKAKQSGLSIVSANRTWYTGMLSYYAEQAAEQNLVSIIASNASPWVAPYGGSEGRFGTNPICYGFPSDGEPVIWDIGTSAIIHAEVTLHKRLNQPLKPGLAFDAQGAPTTDPAQALQGCFAPWGGPKGSGLAIVVQLMGALAGGPVIPPELAEFGFVIIALDPDLLGSTEAFKAKVADYAETVRKTRPIDPHDPVRMPFDRSREMRKHRQAEGSIEVEPHIYQALEAVLADTSSH